MSTRTENGVTIRKIGGYIGAELSGLDLEQPLTEPQAETIRQALWAHKVIFFRGQHNLSLDGEERFAGRIGTLTETAHPTHASTTPGKPRVTTLDNVMDADLATDHWHTDATYVQRPPAGAVLHAVQLPSCGGDTLWANCAKGYADLPETMRDYIDKLWAVHSNRWGFGHIHTVEGGLIPVPGQAKWSEGTFYGAPFETIHPLVRVHAHIGERSILSGQHLRHIMGLSLHESHDLQRNLQDVITRPENVVRWRWEVGDVAVWDNTASQHYAAHDYTERRRLQRVSLAGEVPVSVDGQTSRQRIGDLSDYLPPPVKKAS